MPEAGLNSSLRLLYVPNEVDEGDQVGPRAAFEGMLADGTLAGYRAFSLLVEARRTTAVHALEQLVELAGEFSPDAVFWQHVSSFPLDPQAIDRLKDLASRPMLVYHEGDVYGTIRKRPTASMKILAARADIVFVVGLGANADLFRTMGARKVIHAPHSADTVRFGKPWDPHQSGRLGVVMIANRIQSRIRWLSLPGALEREELALGLHRRLGRHFSVYGRGWDKFPFGRGRLPYHEQECELRRHLLSVAWNHFDKEPFYFSDRLPIALLAGVAHATNYQAGYELMFRNGEQLAYYHSVSEAVDMVDWMLSRPRSYLVEMGLAGEKLARRQYTTDCVYRNMVGAIVSDLAKRNAHREGDGPVYLQERPLAVDVPNSMHAP
jgi:hypothetical protein